LIRHSQLVERRNFSKTRQIESNLRFLKNIDPHCFIAQYTNIIIVGIFLHKIKYIVPFLFGKITKKFGLTELDVEVIGRDGKVIFATNVDMMRQ